MNDPAIADDERRLGRVPGLPLDASERDHQGGDCADAALVAADLQRLRVLLER